MTKVDRIMNEVVCDACDGFYGVECELLDGTEPCPLRAKVEAILSDPVSIPSSWPADLPEQPPGETTATDGPPMVLDMKTGKLYPVRGGEK